MRKSEKVEWQTKRTVAFGSIEVTVGPEVRGQSELVLELQRLVVELIKEAQGQVEAAKVATGQGEVAAELALSDNLREAATQLGLRDRRLAPLRRVVKSNGKGRTVTLECGHKFTVPGGHEKRARRRRCVECVAEAARES